MSSRITPSAICVSTRSCQKGACPFSLVHISWRPLSMRCMTSGHGMRPLGQSVGALPKRVISRCSQSVAAISPSSSGRAAVQPCTADTSRMMRTCASICASVSGSPSLPGPPPSVSTAMKRVFAAWLPDAQHDALSG